MALWGVLHWCDKQRRDSTGHRRGLQHLLPSLVLQLGPWRRLLCIFGSPAPVEERRSDPPATRQKCFSLDPRWLSPRRSWDRHSLIEGGNVDEQHPAIQIWNCAVS